MVQSNIEFEQWKTNLAVCLQSTVWGHVGDGGWLQRDVGDRHENHVFNKIRTLKIYLMKIFDQKSWTSYRKLTFQRLWDFHADDAFTGCFWSIYNAILITCWIVTWFLPWSTVVIRWFIRMEIYQKSHAYMD